MCHAILYIPATAAGTRCDGVTSHDDRSCSPYETIGQLATLSRCLRLLSLNCTRNTAPAGHYHIQPSADHAETTSLLKPHTFALQPGFPLYLSVWPDQLCFSRAKICISLSLTQTLIFAQVLGRQLKTHQLPYSLRMLSFNTCLNYRFYLHLLAYQEHMWHQ